MALLLLLLLLLPLLLLRGGSVTKMRIAPTLPASSMGHAELAWSSALVGGEKAAGCSGGL